MFILLIVENDRSLTEAGNTIKSQMGNNAHLGKESEGSAESDLLVNCCTNLRDQMHHLFSCPSMCRKSDLQLGFELVQQIVIASWGSKILGDLTWGCQILGEL